VPTIEEDVRSALIRRWELIARAVPEIDPAAPSRIDGWSNGEVLAHLYVQPHLVIRFLRTTGYEGTNLSASDNLAGTNKFKDLIDASARKGAKLNKFDLGISLASARGSVMRAPLHKTIQTLQGSITVADYLVTRCVEAVVHGSDLVQPVPPDPAAEKITVNALLNALSESAPHLVAEAQALPGRDWINVATGRVVAVGRLATGTPVMS